MYRTLHLSVNTNVLVAFCLIHPIACEQNGMQYCVWFFTENKVLFIYAAVCFVLFF